MAIQEAPPQAPVQAQAACPNCSAPAQPGQLVCLECGARLGLRYRKPSPWRRLPAAGLGALALIAAAGFGFALREITSDDEVERASSPAPAQPEPSDAAP